MCVLGSARAYNATEQRTVIIITTSNNNNNIIILFRCTRDGPPYPYTRYTRRCRRAVFTDLCRRVSPGVYGIRTPSETDRVYLTCTGVYTVPAHTCAGTVSNADGIGRHRTVKPGRSPPVVPAHTRAHATYALVDEPTVNVIIGSNGSRTLPLGFSVCTSMCVRVND